MSRRPRSALSLITDIAIMAGHAAALERAADTPAIEAHFDRAKIAAELINWCAPGHDQLQLRHRGVGAHGRKA